MNESFVGVFSVRKHGFFYTATAAFLLGSLLSVWNLPYRLLKGTAVVVPKAFMMFIILACLSTLIFIGLAYAVKSDWLFIPLLGLGYSAYMPAARLLYKSMGFLNPDFKIDYLEGIVTGFVYGLILALVLVIFMRLNGVGIFSFILSFVLAQACASACYILFFLGIKNYTTENITYHVAQIIGEGIFGAIFFYGFILNYKRMKHASNPAEYAA